MLHARNEVNVEKISCQKIVEKPFSNLPPLPSNQFKRQSSNCQTRYDKTISLFRRPFYPQILFIDKLFYSTELSDSIIDSSDEGAERR